MNIKYCKCGCTSTERVCDECGGLKELDPSQVNGTKSYNRDIVGNEIQIGDVVAFAPGGAYAGVNIGKVKKFSPKKITIVSMTKISGRHIGMFHSYDEENRYYAYPWQVVIININL